MSGKNRVSDHESNLEYSNLSPQTLGEFSIPENGKSRMGDISFSPAVPACIPDLKLFNAGMFPVSYSEKFYETVLRLPNLTSLGYCGNELIGAVCCRTESAPDQEGVTLYIMTLGVKPLFRRRGIASQMLRLVVSHHELQVSKIYLHVQISNEDAIAFYHGLGFVTEKQITNYYARLDPPHCFLLSRPLDGLAEAISSKQK